MFGYVQDERNVVVPWMAKNDDVQDERPAFVGRHERSEARQSMEIDNQ